MNILVCLKQTFDTEEKVIIQKGQICEEDVEFVINPYDEYAVEEALKLRDQFGGEITAVTLGPARAESALRTALAMGVDKAIIVDDEILFGDEYTTSKVLAAVARYSPYDIIIAGYMSIDSGAAQGGPRLAEELGIAHISTVTKLEIEGNQLKAERDVEGDVEIIHASLPILITAQQGLNEPRYPSLMGIMKAKKKPLERLNADNLGLSAEEVRAKTEIIEQFAAPKKQAGRILEGEKEMQVAELAALIRDEVKVNKGV